MTKSLQGLHDAWITRREAVLKELDDLRAAYEAEFERVKEAIKAGKTTFVEGSHKNSMEGSDWQVDFEGRRYAVSEIYEYIVLIREVPIDPTK